MNKKILILIIFYIILLIIPIYAQICDINKAKQYSFNDETTNFYVNVKIENKDYCVYKYDNYKSSYSEIIVLDENNERLNEINSEKLQEVIFSYKTATYLESNYSIIEPILQAIYDDLIKNSEEYKSNLDGIREEVDFISQFIKIDIPIYGALKIDAVKSLKYLVSGFLPPPWKEIINRYKIYKETIDQISIAKIKGYISYDDEIKVFYNEIIAIDNFVKAVDKKTESGISKQFDSLSFTNIAQEISANSIKEVELINSRVNDKKMIAIKEKNNLTFYFNLFEESLDNSLTKKANTSKYKEEYCKFKKSMPDPYLIDREMFQDYIEKAGQLRSDIQIINDELNKNIEGTKDKSQLFILIDRIFWFFGKIC